MNEPVWTRIAKNTYSLKVPGATLYRYRYKGSFGTWTVADPDEGVAFIETIADDQPTVSINIDHLENLNI